jgi:hypothetical protein
MLAQEAAAYIVLGNNKSTGNACAWHDVYHWTFNRHQQTTTIIYVPNHGIVDDGCYPDGNAAYLLNSITWRVSHELIEAITDPYPCTPTGAPGSKCTARSRPAWAKADDVTWEVGDICQQGRLQYLTFKNGDRVLVQPEWSNRASACVVVGP